MESQHICFTDSAGKALFSIPDNGLPLACSMETGTGTLLFVIVWMTPIAEIDGVKLFAAGFCQKG